MSQATKLLIKNYVKVMSLTLTACQGSLSSLSIAEHMGLYGGSGGVIRKTWSMQAGLALKGVV